MKKTNHSATMHPLICALALLCAALPSPRAATEILFEDDFNRGIPGWTAVQPPEVYIEGPMRWQYDIVSDAFIEHSNIYTGPSGGAGSPTATAVMLINEAETGPAFTYKARLIAGDDDAFGLIFGYQDTNNFYRVTFTRQNRSAQANPTWPYTSWIVDQKVDGVATNLFGWGTPTFFESFRNTQYQPFDVTITVTDQDLFSLTVVDDPDGLAIPYLLVENQPLPGPADGQVGLVSWGMSGTALRGFRITNLDLDPVDLVGNPNALEAWTPVVTPRADGTGLVSNTGNGGVPIWSLALGENGDFGTLQENSDSHGGNTADGRVDFAAGSVVAGDESWSNYVYTVRIIPGDDDGHGLLLRYVDELNFYRIALRAQASDIGVRQGLSIQKVVNGLWEEVFFEETPQFVPPNNVPYEISALAFNDRLQVVIIADPDGTPARYSYGPFDLTGDTIPTGKIGLFSWAMLPPVQFDWVNVAGIDGIPLEVTSIYGEPTPPVGAIGYDPGTSITASVQSPVDAGPGVRRVVTGWTGTGSVPPSGTESSVTFTLNEISSIVWHWITEYQVQATSTAGGNITGVPGEWVEEGTEFAINAEADEGYVFVGWSGTTRSTANPLDFSLAYPLDLQAHFEADSDGDGLPDSWEQLYFEDLAQTATGDDDQDGLTNLEEFQRGTHPASDETLLAEDGLPPSPWVNVQRDPALPGQLVVRDFGDGFRGVWENSNDFRWADDPYFGTNAVANVSFDGPRMIISDEVWQSEWSDFTGSAIFSVGDNDGNCVYFRYQDENNWYRVTATEENSVAAARAKVGISVQKKVDGVFSELAYLDYFWPDRTDTTWYKRFRITVIAQGPNFEIHVTGWNALVEPPIWDTGTEAVLFAFDEDLATGRFGVGTWGQGGGNTATATNPVNAGVLIEDVVIEVNNEVVFSEDWEQVPLAAELPAGWEVPFTEGQDGNWQVTAHSSILQSSNDTRGGEGVVLLAPAPNSANYFLELGFHPYDDDGIGFVYNFQDTNNYSRVMFVSEGTAAGRIPQGINLSQKSEGVWSDIFLEERSFIYEPGQPFGVEFANNNGQYRMKVWNLENPASAATIAWTGPAAETENRFGFTTWGETDAHFLYARAYSLPALAVIPPTEVEITGISVQDGTLTFTVDLPAGATYAIEQSTTLEPGSWSTVAQGLTAAAHSMPLPEGEAHAFYRVRLE